MKKVNYSKLFTKRKNGVYQKYVDGKYLYSKNPEELYQKWQEHLTGPPKKTFREIAESWEAKHRDEIEIRTWVNYKPHYEDLLDQFGDMPIDQISTQHINADLNKAKAKGYSATIVKTRKSIFSLILDHAIDMKEISINPVYSVKLPKNLPRSKRSAPTEEEMRVIIENINAPFGFYPFFLLFTGMRKSEALALTRADIDLERKQISVTKSLDYAVNAHPVVKPPKTENGVRTIPILAILRDPLVNYLQNINTDIIFPCPPSNRNKGGGYMTEKSFETAWKKYCEYTGLNITAHQLRHGAATLMFEAGVDMHTAQRILGHSNINTTLGIYTELREKQQAKSIDKLDEELYSRYGKK